MTQVLDLVATNSSSWPVRMRSLIPFDVGCVRSASKRWITTSLCPFHPQKVIRWMRPCFVAIDSARKRPKSWLWSSNSIPQIFKRRKSFKWRSECGCYPEGRRSLKSGWQSITASSPMKLLSTTTFFLLAMKFRRSLAESGGERFLIRRPTRIIHNSLLIN